MSVTIGPRLELIQLPRRPDLGDYDWFDLESAGVQVGKARCRITPERFTVFSIMVYPEDEGNGYARQVIGHFQRQDPLDRRRPGAPQRPGFLDQGRLHCGYH